MSGSSLSRLDRDWQAQFGPYVGFSAAAEAAVYQLNRQVPGLDLWLVTSVAGDCQRVLARAGRWADRAPVGAEFSWQASFCVRMITGQGPAVAASFATVPAYQQAAVGPLAQVRSYLGVPILFGDGALFGTLCALSGREQSDRLSEAMPGVTVQGRLLASVLDGQRAAHARSADAADAYALAERDSQTGLRNRRGWEQALATEQGRGLRFGTRSSIALVTLAEVEELAGPTARDQLSRCAEVLTEICQPGDVAARTGDRQFSVLAVEADALAARALQTRLRRALGITGLPGWTATATRWRGEELSETWQRAQRTLLAEQRRHPRPLSPARPAASTVPRVPGHGFW